MAEYEETEYAKRVVDWFDNRDWTCYKEVQSPRENENSKRVADIYAITGTPQKPRKSHVVEVKTSFSLQVMMQARYWQRHAHYASVAVPAGMDTRLRKFALDVCGELGLGVFAVVEGDHAPLYADQIKRPDRSGVARYPRLVEAQRHYLAGNADGEYWTAFQETAQQLIELTEENGIIALDDALALANHHYNSNDSAMSTLKRSIPDCAIPELKLLWRDSIPYLVLRGEDESCS